MQLLSATCVLVLCSSNRVNWNLQVGWSVLAARPGQRYFKSRETPRRKKKIWFLAAHQYNEGHSFLTGLVSGRTPS